MPLDDGSLTGMSFLLMILLAALCLTTSYPPPLWGGPGWLPPVLMSGLVLLVALLAAFIARDAQRPLDADPASIDRTLSRYERWRWRHSVFGLFAFLAGVFLAGWGHWARGLYPEPGEGHGVEMLLLLPYLLAQILSWLSFYDADRAAHVASHRLAAPPFAPALGGEAVAVPSFGGRWSYVFFQLRQKIGLAFIPILLLILRQEVFRLLPARMAHGSFVSYGLSISGLLLVFVGLPLLLRLVLGLSRMPDGPLRSRLQATARRMGVNVSDILIWNTRQGVANALVIGLVPWLRYVVFTDKILEEFSPEELQAVFGHELGHVKHQHMLYYLGFLMLSMTVLALTSDHYLLPALRSAGNALSSRYPSLLPAGLGEWMGPQSDLTMIPVLAVVLAYLLIVFGFLSRRCERQADVFGCRAVSCGDPRCAGHGEDTEYAPDRPLCFAGVRTFMRALDKVAAINGVDRHNPGFFQSWQHSTIALRTAFLHGMIHDKRREPAFQRGLGLLKWGLAGALGVAAAWLFVVHGIK